MQNHTPSRDIRQQMEPCYLGFQERRGELDARKRQSDTGSIVDGIQMESSEAQRERQPSGSTGDESESFFHRTSTSKISYMVTIIIIKTSPVYVVDISQREDCSPHTAVDVIMRNTIGRLELDSCPSIAHRMTISNNNFTTALISLNSVDKHISESNIITVEHCRWTGGNDSALKITNMVNSIINFGHNEMSDYSSLEGGGLFIFNVISAYIKITDSR